jgi:hypothetical protein
MPTWLSREVRAEKESVHKKAEADSASDCKRISSCSSCNVGDRVSTYPIKAADIGSCTNTKVYD